MLSLLTSESQLGTVPQLSVEVSRSGPWLQHSLAAANIVIFTLQAGEDRMICRCDKFSYSSQEGSILISQSVSKFHNRSSGKVLDLDSHHLGVPIVYWFLYMRTTLLISMSGNISLSSLMIFGVSNCFLPTLGRMASTLCMMFSMASESMISVELDDDGETSDDWLIFTRLVTPVDSGSPVADSASCFTPFGWGHLYPFRRTSLGGTSICIGGDGFPEATKLGLLLILLASPSETFFSQVPWPPTLQTCEGIFL